jgi:crossover junction endodeoxyribonuclease RuvC
MNALCMGVDPGVTGAIAFYFPDAADRILAEDTPGVAGEVDGVTLSRRIKQLAPTFAIVERVASMPGQGVASTFKFGKAIGTALGVLGVLEIPIHLVAPGVWKKHFRLSADKEQARALALRLFPSTSDHFARKKDHGRAEAGLIALYGAQCFDKGRF